MLEIYNTLTRAKQKFVPIEPGKVRMYVCGMTVYDYCHLGHARVLVVFDMVLRYLRALDYQVTYVRNITDVDDKIIQRAQQNNEDIATLTERFIVAMQEDAQALGVLSPTLEPRATKSMAQILEMIERLLTRGLAYQADNGDVYYDVSEFASYGALSGKKLSDLRAGARVDVDAAKQDPLDFVLWKQAKPGEPSWDSPWGQGRPGWHIECSAMSTSCLGAHFDIHGGGMDLQFPHHENEIAQSEGATQQKFVNLWMHNGFVRIDDEKMSKSLGNFFTVREILARYRAEVVRYFILTSHYRSPLNYADEHLETAKGALRRLYQALRDLPTVPDEQDLEVGDEFSERFFAAMDDDFNTPDALAVLFELAREVNRFKQSDARKASALGWNLCYLAGLLGLLQEDPEVYLQGDGVQQEVQYDAEAIEQMIAARRQARAAKDWPRADQIRQQLEADGVILEDQGDATTWRRS